MLSEKERAYISYWQDNRDKQKKNTVQFIIGLSVGLSIGAATISLLASGWYIRANMEANSKLNPTVLAVIIISIAVFMAYMYRRHKWEMQEQQYLELLAKKRKEEKSGCIVQQQQP